MRYFDAETSIHQRQKLCADRSRSTIMKLLCPPAWLPSTEVQVAYQEKCGNLPAVNAAYETIFVTNEEMRAAFKEQLQYGKAYPSVAGWGPSETLLQKGLSNVWDNVMGVFGSYAPAKTKEFLDQTANEFSTIYSQD